MIHYMNHFDILVCIHMYYECKVSDNNNKDINIPFKHNVLEMLL